MRWHALFIFAAVVIGSEAAAQQPENRQDDDKFVGGGGIVPDLLRVANVKSCINGHNPFAEDTTARILGLSEQTLVNYVRIAGVNTGANIFPLYTKKRRSLGWGEGTYKRKPVEITWSRDGVSSDLSLVDDPLARMIVASNSDPTSALKMEKFLISGVKHTATGTWRIVDPRHPDKALGRYRVRFMRENSLGGQAWSLLSMEVFSNPATAADVIQYCAEPGDVERERVRLLTEAAERERRKREKGQGRADQRDRRQ